MAGGMATGGCGCTCDEDPGVPPVNCATCAPGLAPGQVIVTLPAIANNRPFNFNHAGGDFLLDFYGSKTCTRNVGIQPVCAVGAPLAGNPTPTIEPNNEPSGPFSNYAARCGYMGAVLGTHCGGDVRPFAIYGFSLGGGAPGLLAIGYAKARVGVIQLGGGVAPPFWAPFTIYEGAADGENNFTRWDLGSVTAGPCLTTNYNRAYVGRPFGIPPATLRRLSDCEAPSTTPGATGSTGSCQLSARPA